MSNKEIGSALFITERTARTYVSNILGKLGLASRTQAALWAVEHKLVEPPGLTRAGPPPRHRTSRRARTVTAPPTMAATHRVVGCGRSAVPRRSPPQSIDDPVPDLAARRRHRDLVAGVGPISARRPATRSRSGRPPDSPRSSRRS